MRRKYVRMILFVMIVCLIWFKLYFNFNSEISALRRKYDFNNSSMKTSKFILSESFTIVLRQFQLYENDVTLTAQSFKNLFPNVILWIVYDDMPYPPLDLDLTNKSLSNIKLYNLSPSLNHRESLVSQIKTNYVLLIPDSTRITSRRPIELMIEALKKNPDNIIAVPIGGYVRNLKCLRVNVNQREWTIRYILIKGTECDAVSGKHLIMLKKDILDQLYDPLLLPFPQSMYVQTSFQSKKINIVKINFLHNGKPIFKSHHSQLMKKQSEQELLRNFYKKFKIKQVIRETGNTEWYGCNKDTPKCFGTVLESIPSYLYDKKWTPPCCMSNLRKTARHVFSILDEAGVRYWLEAGSLLGAMRSGDILPWDYNVDIGFVREDMNRCKWLKKSQTKPVVDRKGFLWEKGTDGNLFKVSYSKINKIHVNLFPFYSKNGTMVKDSWFTNHRNMEFAESFLHPMSSIDFVGRNVPSPNNIRDFLEFKYGKGCIENPQYPGQNKITFP